MKKVYCYKCDLEYWTPVGKKEIEQCPFCGLSNDLDKNQADNLEIADKMKILGVEVAETKNDYG